MSEHKLEFYNKSCKNNCHNLCDRQWEGLGFEVICNCDCHLKPTVNNNKIQSNTIAKKILSL
jgi:hypothetical protein